MMTGDYFHQVGEEYGEQNPMYTTRTFAENLLTTEGRPAFDAIDDGALAVLGAQMEQFGRSIAAGASTPCRTCGRRTCEGPRAL